MPIRMRFVAVRPPFSFRNLVADAANNIAECLNAATKNRSPFRPHASISVASFIGHEVDGPYHVIVASRKIVRLWYAPEYVQLHGKYPFLGKMGKYGVVWTGPVDEVGALCSEIASVMHWRLTAYACRTYRFGSRRATAS